MNTNQTSELTTWVPITELAIYSAANDPLENNSKGYCTL